MQDQWFALRHRLLSRGLMPSPADSLSLRLPGEDAMWWGTAGDAQPQRVALDGSQGPPDTSWPISVHRQVYAWRQDACAMLYGGGAFGRQLPHFGGHMPAVFDEQIRQLGIMGPASGDLVGLHRSLAQGGNAAVLDGQVLLLGMTASRLALNAELFEKCAKAYVCAVAGGGRVRPLPWLVRTIANGRLMKEEGAARVMVRSGRLPAETRGY
ncbi:hypothetical protein [Roseateles depolymerans]|uniref:Uncharacterized protein n=1 Tax=Roseateles depolymerans TaxID=76731 RepID=A0A0U3N3Y0_9BURK|nr:hypothetical protein [Roseateles depolymerans]ALV06907.1 hypothetical protein RD2015_2439 [Roseateles depolymerans]REG19887.1 ribulose-5-phosphate 4-epimerase/fuculose-1-phosphate aldolase [Roseateles depolymerans]